MTPKAIQYQNGYLFIDGTRTTGKICYDDTTEKVGFKASHPKYDEDGLTIIAQSPELSIPDIPYVELEENIPQLAASIAMEHKQHGEQWMLGCVYGVVKGYKAAQSKKYSEEDLVKFTNWLIEYCAETHKDKIRMDIPIGNEKITTKVLSSTEVVQQYIQSLQPKIESIELEMEGCKGMCDKIVHDHSGETSPCTGGCEQKQPVTYQKDGKTFLKVKQINYEA